MLAETERVVPLHTLNEMDRQMIEAAMIASEEEKKMSFRQVISTHRKAALWSCVFSLALVMEG
jgi:hypothetical protein